MGKIEPKWVDGVWLGVNDMSGEHIVHTNGHITMTRSIKRKTPDARWRAGEIRQINIWPSKYCNDDNVAKFVTNDEIEVPRMNNAGTKIQIGTNAKVLTNDELDEPKMDRNITTSTSNSEYKWVRINGRMQKIYNDDARKRKSGEDNDNETSMKKLRTDDTTKLTENGRNSDDPGCLIAT